MKPLPLILRKNGFSYIQVLRTGRSCIYEQRVSEDLKAFEVFTVKIKPGQTYDSGQDYPEREVFPCDEDFGKSAKTFRTIEEARNRFKILVEKERAVKNRSSKKVKKK